MKDYSIKGTPLPVIKGETRLEYRITFWGEFSKNEHKIYPEKDFVSFGLKEFKNTMYVLAEKAYYVGKNYYMFKLSDIKRLDEEQIVLPENWCIKLNEDNSKVVNKWFNKNSQNDCRSYNCNSYTCYMHYPVYNKYYHALDYIQSGYEEITFEQFKKHVLKEKFNNQSKKEMTTRTITHTQAQEIIDIACSTWKEKLFTLWGKKIVLRQEVEIIEVFYQEMRNACTTEQHILFDKIFGEDLLYKKGDWVYVGVESSIWHSAIQLTKDVNFSTNKVFAKTRNGNEGWLSIYVLQRLATEEEIKAVQFPPKGTPCLVRQHFVSSWNLAYSNGDGKFTSSDKDNSVVTYKHYQILDINNLPIK